MQSRQFEINKKEIIIQQNLDYGHAGSVWDAALVFAHYLEKNCKKVIEKQMFEGKIILELGSGTGIAGLLTTVFNPKKVVLTDMQQNQEILQQNIECNKNKISNGIEVINQSLEWGLENKDKIQELIKSHGSDLMYDDANSFKLLQTYEEISKVLPNSQFMLVFNIRKESEREIIKKIESTYNFQYVSEQDYDQTYRDDDIGIIMFNKKEI